MKAGGINLSLLSPERIPHIAAADCYAGTAVENSSSRLQWGFYNSWFANSDVSPYGSSQYWAEQSSGGIDPKDTFAQICQSSLSAAEINGETQTTYDGIATPIQYVWQGWKGVQNEVSLWTTGLVNLLHFQANSPVYASSDVNVPSNANVLTFNLSVADPGNDDHLLVMMGNDVLQDIDLASAQAIGGATEQIWINDYAGQQKTLTFYMPSPDNVHSSAEFSVSDMNFVDVNFPPLALWDASSVSFDHSTATFTVTYTDTDNAVLLSTIGSGNIQVTSPNGTNLSASLVGSPVANSDGSEVTATYRIDAPNETWGSADAGTYTVWMQSDQVSDSSANNYVAAGAIGAFDIGPLTVVPNSLQATPTGFTVQFNSTLDPSQLNLYDLGGTWGPADVVLMGKTTGPVSGSVVINAAGDGFTFIETGSVLAPDTYTVTLHSAANGFKDTAGLLLDGNDDGTAGDDYTGTFTVDPSPSNAVTVSLPDFARGYGQPVNVPATGTGLPLTISSGQNVGSLSLTLDYDPTLLTINTFTPAGLSATLDTSTPGVAVLTVTSTGPFSSTSGLFTVGTFSAQVPNSATYGAKEILHFASLQVKDTSGNVLPSLADDAIHLAAYFGDTSGSGSYNSPDTTLIRRLIGQVQTGLLAYPLADPMLIRARQPYWVARVNRHDSYSPRYRANPGRGNPATARRPDAASCGSGPGGLYSDGLDGTPRRYHYGSGQARRYGPRRNHYQRRPNRDPF